MYLSKLLLAPVSALLLGAVGCGNDLKISESAKCDGQQQGSEETVDSPFDADQDGYFDAANPDCLETYEEALLDCSDQDEDVHPGLSEVICNGLDDDCNVDTLDAADADGDGYDACLDCDDVAPGVNPGAGEIVCDGTNNDCDDATLDDIDADLDGYGSCTDCADADPDVSPGTPEVACNGIDDDCTDVTPDGPDADADLSPSCSDCDDNDNQRSPTFTEICDDGIDNDCDLEIDDGCDVDYTGTYTMSTTSTYSCAFGFVSISLSQLTVIDANPIISFSARGSQPGTMSGTIDSADAFSVDNILSGSCTEEYTLDGSFVSDDYFTGTFKATFLETRPGDCFGCVDQSWAVDGYR